MAQLSKEKVACRSPNAGKDGTTNIPKWKFDLIETILLNRLKQGDATITELRNAVFRAIDAKTKERLGSVNWHTTSVRLEMEVRGDISRLKGVVPMTITLGGA